MPPKKEPFRDFVDPLKHLSNNVEYMTKRIDIGLATIVSHFRDNLSKYEELIAQIQPISTYLENNSDNIKISKQTLQMMRESIDNLHAFTESTIDIIDSSTEFLGLTVAISTRLTSTKNIEGEDIGNDLAKAVSRTVPIYKSNLKNDFIKEESSNTYNDETTRNNENVDVKAYMENIEEKEHNNSTTKERGIKNTFQKKEEIVFNYEDI